MNEGKLDPKSSLTCSAGVVMLRPVSDEIRVRADAIQETCLVVGSARMRVKRAFLSASWHELAGSARPSVLEPMVLLDFREKVRVEGPEVRVGST